MVLENSQVSINGGEGSVRVSRYMKNKEKRVLTSMNKSVDFSYV